MATSNQVRDLYAKIVGGIKKLQHMPIPDGADEKEWAAMLVELRRAEVSVRNVMSRLRMFDFQKTGFWRWK